MVPLVETSFLTTFYVVFFSFIHEHTNTVDSGVISYFGWHLGPSCMDCEAICGYLSIWLYSHSHHRPLHVWICGDVYLYTLSNQTMSPWSSVVNLHKQYHVYFVHISCRDLLLGPAHNLDVNWCSRPVVLNLSDSQSR